MKGEIKLQEIMLEKIIQEANFISGKKINNIKDLNDDHFINLMIDIIINKSDSQGLLIRKTLNKIRSPETESDFNWESSEKNIKEISLRNTDDFQPSNSMHWFEKKSELVCPSKLSNEDKIDFIKEKINFFCISNEAAFEMVKGFNFIIQNQVNPEAFCEVLFNEQEQKNSFIKTNKIK